MFWLTYVPISPQHYCLFVYSLNQNVDHLGNVLAKQ